MQSWNAKLLVIASTCNNLDDNVSTFIYSFIPMEEKLLRKLCTCISVIPKERERKKPKNKIKDARERFSFATPRSGSASEKMIFSVYCL